MKVRGLSLIELLLVIGLIASLIVVSLPVISQTMRHIQLQMTTNQLRRIMNSARLYAIADNQRVIICPSADGVGCGGRWQQGILLTSTQQQGEVIHYYPWHYQAITVSYRGFPYSDRIEVKPSGVLSQQNGRFILSYPTSHGDQQQQLIISRTGRIRLATGNTT